MTIEEYALVNIDRAKVIKTKDKDDLVDLARTLKNRKVEFDVLARYHGYNKFVKLEIMK